MAELSSPLPPKRRIMLLTGMSGAGLSSALKIFEDLGYEAVDNLRLGLVPTLIKDRSTTERPLAIAIDSRNASFSADDMLETAGALAADKALAVQLVFFECSDETLQRRFTETRRRHPLAADRPVTDGIQRERELLWKLRDAADNVIDTSQLSVHDLRRLVAGHYRITGDLGLTLYVTSFSYRHGVPREADLVFDARFLGNPHWEPHLRPLTGRDRDVATYVRNDPDFPGFLVHMRDLLLPLLPRYQQEGKSYLTVAIGCTGGRHRSVFVAEELATVLAMYGYITGVGHRDLDRSANKA